MTAPDRFLVELRTALLRARVDRSYWRNLCRDRDAETRRLADRCERLEAELAEAEALIAKVDDAAHEHFRAVGVEVPDGHDFGAACLRLADNLERFHSGVTSCVPEKGGGGRYVAVDRVLEDEGGGR